MERVASKLGTLGPLQNHPGPSLRPPDPISIVLLPGFEYRMHEWRHPTTHEMHWPVKVPVQPLSRTRLLSAGSRPSSGPRPLTWMAKMSSQPLRVLISGASVAGPTSAYWLCRRGFAVTVVERMPLVRVRTSGHAVDLFGPAMDVAEWSGVLPAVMDARTRTEIVSFQRRGGRGVEVEMRRLVAGISGRHVEVMRGQLAAILYEATRSDAQYLFEDSISTIVEEPEGIAVTFEHAPADRFDIVIGADGLHSIVRRLVFGPEDQFRRFLGGYLAGAA